MRIIFATFLFVLFFSQGAFAVPVIHDPVPGNNSFIAGGSHQFGVNVTEADLNTSSVIFYIISESAYLQNESWDSDVLDCTESGSEWFCSNKTVSFAIVGSDTVELFYFEASDTSGNTVSYGNPSSPLRTTLDRGSPIISFVSPVNNSFVNGNKTVSVTVADTASGVDNATVEYSINNITWTQMKNSSLTSFEAAWDTTSVVNNLTVALYVRASDNIRNNATVWINVTADNEIPDVVVLSDLSGTLTGNVQLQVNVTDDYSGIALTNVRYSVGSLNGALGCAGSNYSATCSAVINTASLDDGNYTLTVTAADNAGNSNATPIQITTKNTQPTITILQPTGSAFIGGQYLVRTTLTNTEGIVNYVQLSIEQGNNITTSNMTCSQNYSSCNYTIDTALFIDGGYTLRAKVFNTLGSDIQASVLVTFDDTKPLLIITQPTGSVAGDFEIKTDVTDTNLDQKKVLFNISSFNGSLSCTPQTPSRFICSTSFNSKQLSDGKYNLNATAEDKAGNIAVSTKEITITNHQGGVSTASGSSGAGNISNDSSSSVPTRGEEESGSEKKPLINISIPFETKYIILAVVVATVAIILVVSAVIVKQRLGQTIITDR